MVQIGECRRCPFTFQYSRPIWRRLL
jgi:hypothetical protein